MESFALITALFFLTVTGWSILSFITIRGNDLSIPERLSLSYGIGLGFISLEMFIFDLLGIPFWTGYLAIPCAVCIVCSGAASYLTKKTVSSGKALVLRRGPRRSFGFTVLFAAGIGVEVIYAFFRALIKPLESYDAVAIYGIKAKIFHLARSIPGDYFGSLRDIIPHPDYPLNIPLVEAFLFGAMGTLNDQLVKMIFPLYFVGILVLIYCGIRRFADRTYAMIFTFITASIPQLTSYAANGYVDIVLSYYWFAGFLYMFLWFQEKRSSYLIISAIMVGLAGWTKNEGLLYCAVAALLFLTYLLFQKGRARLRPAAWFLAYAAIIGALVMPWVLTKRFFHIVNDETGLAGFDPLALIARVNKIPAILYEFQKEFFNPKKWNLLWPVVFCSIAFRFRRAFDPVRKYAGLSIIFAIFGYVGVYFASPLEISYLVSKTWSRFLIHFLPVAVYWAAITMHEDVKA
ncbi:MAG: glycosyltransferase family 39 protein [Candidatus Omnitrophota bacterium]